MFIEVQLWARCGVCYNSIAHGLGCSALRSLPAD